MLCNQFELHALNSRAGKDKLTQYGNQGIKPLWHTPKLYQFHFSLLRLYTLLVARFVEKQLIKKIKKNTSNLSEELAGPDLGLRLLPSTTDRVIVQTTRRTKTATVNF